jgi:ferric-dicitrate binding protein FerR (iron transport regulator)
MKQENRHTNRHSYRKNDPDGLSHLFSSRSEIPWEKSKDEVWNDLEGKLFKEDQLPVPARPLHPYRHWLALAGSLVLLLAVSAFMRLYTVKTYCPEGVRSSVQLPDGSGVELNASTHLSYHPYWWFISREVKLEGEAFFSVENGRNFRVLSSLGSTKVLGTTFNVFARGADFIVTCHSGSVRVSEARGGAAVTLSPYERSILEPAGGFKVIRLENSPDTPGWTGNMIMFSSAPLRLVFEEIERQFGIVIETPAEMQQVYSGNFSLDQPVENILSLLCLPFDLEYERKNGNTYLVFPSRD